MVTVQRTVRAFVSVQTMPGSQPGRPHPPSPTRSRLVPIPMASLMLVANPAASQFTGGAHRDILHILSARHKVEAVWPRTALHARDIAADAVTAGFDGVIAMGGDGVVHQVAQALVGTDVFMGVVPAGTTNVFARQIGVPEKALRAARHLGGEMHLASMAVVEVQSIHPDGTGATSSALFAVGVGMDADVVEAAEAEPYRKYRFGGIHYARTAIGLLWRDVRRRRPGLTAVGDGRTAPGVAVMVQFRDAFTYFGSRALRFERHTPDPMTALVVRRLPMRRVPSLLTHLLSSTPGQVPGLEVWTRLEELTVDADPPALHEVDGEVLGRAAKVVLTYRPDALWVAVPPRRAS
jgi:diacylglycerol kinase family enzyme